MLKVEEGTSITHSHTLQQLEPHSEAFDSSQDQVSAPLQPDYNQDNVTQKIRSNTTNFDSSSQTLQTNQTQHCEESEGSLIDKPTIQNKMIHFCEIITAFSNRKLLSFLTQLKRHAFVALIHDKINEDQGRTKSDHLEGFEVSSSQPLKALKSSQNWWFKIGYLFQLGSVFTWAIHAQKGESRRFETTFVKTFIIEKKGSIDLSVHQSTLVPRISKISTDPILQEEKLTIKMLEDRNFFKQFSEYEYLFLTEKYLDIPDNEEDFKNYSVKHFSSYADSICKYKLQNENRENSLIKRYVLINVKDPLLADFIKWGCQKLELNQQNFDWDIGTNYSVQGLPMSTESMVITNSQLNPEQKNKQIQKNPRPEAPTPDQKTSNICDVSISNEGLQETITEVNQIKEKVQAQIQKQTEEIKQLEQSSKEIHKKSQTLLQQTERKIKNTEKQFGLLMCWKQLMFDCNKYRCKLGSKCPCSYNERSIEIKAKYLQRLFKYKDRLLQLENKSKNIQNQMENQFLGTIPPNAHDEQKSLITQHSCDMQPLQNVENGQLNKVSSDELKKEARRKKKHKGEHVALHVHASTTIKHVAHTHKVDKIKREKCNYTEQQLNLHNLLDQLQLDQGYRSPCYVEEGAINKWKQMANNYKKKRTQNPVNEEKTTPNINTFK